ncbi:MAG: TRAP transporter substrate-binding protein [Planctomycetota bacterium]|jgi:TRAP-type C4-dicarboxylate transport system substrate-binding protein
MKAKEMSLILALVVIASVSFAIAPQVHAKDAKMKPQRWNLTQYMPAMTAFYDIELQAAFDRIKERTDGMLIVKVVPNGVLPIKPADWIRAVKSGELQMSYLGGDYHATDYPMWAILNVPYLYANKFEKRVAFDAARPILQREMHKEGVHILKYRPCANQSLNLSKKADIFDLKGLKVRSYSKSISRIIETLGGSPISMASSEVATALERGTIDGVLTTASAILQLGWVDPLPYTYDIHLPLGIWTICVNDKLWHSLPADIQGIIHEELDQWVGQIGMYAQIIDMPGIFDKMAAAGATVEVAPPKIIDLMHEQVTKPAMAEAVEKSGAVGEEILEALEAALGRKLR